MGPTPFLTIESSYMYIGSTGNLNTGVNNDCHGTRANRWKTPLGGSDLTPDDCLELMEQYSSIRIACHADYYPGEPHQSRFLFHKGQLSLNEILKKSLENAVLAYTWWMDTACTISGGMARRATATGILLPSSPLEVSPSGHWGQLRGAEETGAAGDQKNRRTPVGSNRVLLHPSAPGGWGRCWKLRGGRGEGKGGVVSYSHPCPPELRATLSHLSPK
ncbi:hypothetical protein FA13DRAFT_1708120 [Coprinellus micaceus]|uniref:Uncharacterized protein n=1 Tax=Coprinellus micaceus TaxID=71717 RepID=A0A4Y7TIF9_COPMI|nr:hypothetical protein FA13DRAFT_1708120 [Coprinellus micaceus]